MIETILAILLSTQQNVPCDPELGCIIIEEPKCTEESPCPIINPNPEEN